MAALPGAPLSPLCTMQRRVPALERPYRERAHLLRAATWIHRAPLLGKGAALPLSPSLAHLGSFCACGQARIRYGEPGEGGGEDEVWKDEAPRREGSPQALPTPTPMPAPVLGLVGKGRMEGGREGRRRRSSPCIPPRFTVGAGRENRARRLQAPRVFLLERAEWE